jgi:transcriptional antiterminator RfaH
MFAEHGAANWYAAQTKPNSHWVAQRNLEQQGFEVFLPIEESSLRRGAQFRVQRRPLFAGYLFIHFAADQAPWRAINNSYGVSKLITSGVDQRPAMVPRALIAALKGQCDGEGVYRGSAGLLPGDRVLIRRGPFAEFVATVESLSPQQRVWILLDIMGSKMRVAIPAYDLQVQV